MKFEEIKSFAEVPIWVRDHSVDSNSGTKLVHDVQTMFAELIDTPMGKASTFTLGEGTFVSPEDNEPCLAKRLTVSVPNVTTMVFSFILNSEGKVFNVKVDELGPTSQSQTLLPAVGFGEIKDILDVADWLASDGSSPELSTDLIEQFNEASAKFLKDLGRDKVELKLGVAQDLLDPTHDKYRVIQLIRQIPYRTIMFVFTMDKRDRITCLEKVTEAHFRQLAATEWRFLQ